MSRRMKIVLTAAALLSIGQLVGACSTANVAANNSAINTTVSQVTSAVKTACSYVAPATEVAAIIGTFTNAGALTSTIGGIAQSICDAVTKTGAGVAPTVNGVALHGHFLAGGRRQRG